jgi:hypothetical protein
MEQCQVRFGGQFLGEWIITPARHQGQAVLATRASCSGTADINGSSHQQKSFPQKAGEKRQEHSTPELEEHQNGIRTAG